MWSVFLTDWHEKKSNISTLQLLHLTRVHSHRLVYHCTIGVGLRETWMTSFYISNWLKKEIINWRHTFELSSRGHHITKKEKTLNKKKERYHLAANPTAYAAAACWLKDLLFHFSHTSFQSLEISCCLSSLSVSTSVSSISLSQSFFFFLIGAFLSCSLPTNLIFHWLLHLLVSVMF